MPVPPLIPIPLSPIPITHHHSPIPLAHHHHPHYPLPPITHHPSPRTLHLVSLSPKCHGYLTGIHTPYPLPISLTTHITYPHSLTTHITTHTHYHLTPHSLIPLASYHYPLALLITTHSFITTHTTHSPNTIHHCSFIHSFIPFTNSYHSLTCSLASLTHTP